jgi:DNA-binding response OmpR family regulator
MIPWEDDPMVMPKILIADDDVVLRELVRMWLEKAGYGVAECASGPDVVPAVLEGKPDLVLLDVVMGSVNGVQICGQLKKNPQTRLIPVILISGARMEEEDQVTGLEGGADDYLVKPLNRLLLMAKIEAVLRRMQAPQELQEVLQRYGLTLDVAERRVTLHGEEVRLTRKEFDLLTVLLKKQGRVVTPRSLLESVWGYEPDVYDDPHTVEVHISRLKKKLGKSFASHITTLVGSGYRLD